jgi:DNA polymerase-4
MSHYQAVSKQVFSIFREVTPLVEGLSLDEAFLDVTASVALFGSPIEIARSIKQRILDETQLTASVGVAENKLVAKIASDLDKPDGLTVVYPADYEARLDPLPVSVIPGIGKKTLERLDGTGIETVRDLRLAEDRVLRPVFGRFSQRTKDRAAGIDDRPVVSEREDKSISTEETYDTDLDSREEMERELLRLSERTATRLRKARLAAGTVQVKIRQSDFSTFTRQRKVNPPANGTDQLYAIACKLLGDWLTANPDEKVRLLGVGGSSLAPAAQQDLFGNHDPESPLDKTVDEIRDRFGSMAVERARTMDND